MTNNSSLSARPVTVLGSFLLWAVTAIGAVITGIVLVVWAANGMGPSVFTGSGRLTGPDQIDSLDHLNKSGTLVTASDAAVNRGLGISAIAVGVVILVLAFVVLSGRSWARVLLVIVGLGAVAAMAIVGGIWLVLVQVLVIVVAAVLMFGSLSGSWFRSRR
jgi:hypothetical protein